MSRLAPGSNYRDWLAYLKHRRYWFTLGPGGVPAGARITEEGDLRITEAGDTRVIE